MFMFTNGGQVQVFSRDGRKGIICATSRKLAERFVQATVGKGASIIEVCDDCNCDSDKETEGGCCSG